MGKVKKLFMILAWACTSLASAQGSHSSGMVPRAPRAEDSVSRASSGKEAVSFNFSEQGRYNRPGAPSVFTALREEVNSFALKLPDISVYWLGVSCYVRNPLRYQLSPGSTYAHQIGLSNGNWILSIDGIKTNTLDDMRVALQYPLGRSVTFLVRYEGTQYRIGVQSAGVLPWE
jgi:hypothetical protein